MTKADIADVLQNIVGGLTKAESAEYVDLVFTLLKKTLAGGEDVLISRFGKFSLRSKHNRIGRNPQTGGKLVIAARTIVTFAPSNTLLKTVNSLE